MDIYAFMNQKQREALCGEKTNIKFPYLNKLYKSESINLIMKKSLSQLTLKNVRNKSKYTTV